jgi:hypothetical protein
MPRRIVAFSTLRGGRRDVFVAGVDRHLHDWRGNRGPDQQPRAATHRRLPLESLLPLRRSAGS